ncbi:Predicted alpha-helical protein, potentially involved in replication/repair [Phaffia rhodozyma]|uniref:DNA replication complex GINS protein PSF1 n=1 Tax=Phaffia rhodozyma TaxID=264483 RepID=A0A0F7SYJ4_PHARH|nr:Predicted alpha-helical protein, potentially involved in replication/repair [Phaffia rhodozyma]
MFGDDALKLMVDARRSTATDTLQKYNTTLVRQICLETRLLHEEIRRSASVSASTSSQSTPLSQNRGLICALTVQHLSTRRNKRCLLAYHKHRLDRLSCAYWQSGGALAHVLNDSDTRSKLSPQEVDFLRAYNDLVLDYKSDFIDLLDLSAGVERPPKGLYVTVKVVKDCGTVYTERGAIDFQKGHRFLVRKGDVDRLISQGYLEEV